MDTATVETATEEKPSYERGDVANGHGANGSAAATAPANAGPSVVLQFLGYVCIGATCTAINLVAFAGLRRIGVSLTCAAPLSFVAASALNYWLCVMTIFRTDARSTNWRRYVLYGLLVGAVAAIDTGVTVACVAAGAGEMLAKACATGVAMVANFTGRKYVVFAKAPGARAG